jgi:molybdopterin synthase sulfur carrier subunit
MITIQVRYFASLRETLGASEDVSLGEGSTIGQLRAVLVARGGRHAEMLDSKRPVRSALNLAMCDECAVLGEGCEVAFFPPVTGG